jgi:hypothetical protein
MSYVIAAPEIMVAAVTAAWVATPDHMGSESRAAAPRRRRQRRQPRHRSHRHHRRHRRNRRSLGPDSNP